MEKMITNDEIDSKIAHLLGDDISESMTKEIRLLCKELIVDENRRCNNTMQQTIFKLLKSK